MAKFGTRSLTNMKGLHPDLLKVLNEAIKNPPFDFTVIDGLRTLAGQKKFVAEGKSKTLKSRHLSGKAVDVMCLINGKGTWNTRIYTTLAKHVLACAKNLGVPIVWGGSWKSFPDFVHFELDKKKYGY